MNFTFSRSRVDMNFSSLADKIHIHAQACNILYLFHRENGFDESTSASKGTRIKRFDFSCACAYVCVSVEKKHRSGITLAEGYLTPMVVFDHRKRWIQMILIVLVSPASNVILMRIFLMSLAFMFALALVMEAIAQLTLKVANFQIS